MARLYAAFISYSLRWSHNAVLRWKLFMIITEGVSVLLSVLVWFQYTNNTAEATFLSLEERIHKSNECTSQVQALLSGSSSRRASFRRRSVTPSHDYLLCSPSPY